MDDQHKTKRPTNRLQQIGKISLAEVTLIESPVEFIHNQQQTTSSNESSSSQLGVDQQQLVSALKNRGGGGGGDDLSSSLSPAHNKLTPTGKCLFLLLPLCRLFVFFTRFYVYTFK